MDSKTVRFAVKDNTGIYKIELARSLLYFVEFDFTYFWEQCIETGKEARKTGRLNQERIALAKNVAANAHPYVEACVSSVFADIVLDCIIEYICQSDKITLDELWTRCISSKNMYEKAVFKRISEYKTNRAVNQWVNIVRIQEYARHKLVFIYGPDENGNSGFSAETIRTRRDYFDLACSVAANELGIPKKQMPSARLCNTASLPEAVFVNAPLSKAIYRRFSESLSTAEDSNFPESTDYSAVKDKLALDAYAYVKEMTRPNTADMKSALDSIIETPEEVYAPDSFKAVIDLEFDLMSNSDIRLRKCDHCARYFAVTSNDKFCDRVNSTGRTCNEQFGDLFGVQKKQTQSAEQSAPQTEQDMETRDESDRKIPPWRLVPPPNKGVPVPKELEKRGQKVYNALYKRLGKGMDENEFKEWSLYLSNMKRNVKNGDSTIEQLVDFLDYSDGLVEEVKEKARQTSEIAPVRIESFYRPEFSADERIAPEESPKTEKTVKPPVWNRMTREEAYKTIDN